jgi:pyroglutamyl-peptidase
VKVLLTGFGPFGNVAENPTERLARHFDGARIGDRLVEGLPLPTSFSRAKVLLRERVTDHELVLMLGVAESEKVIRIETVGRNCDDARIADIDGASPSGRIDEGPEVLPVSVDTHAILAALQRADIPARLSDTAGSYVCNHVLYATLATVDVPRIGFIHVPPADFDMLCLAVEIAISAA